MLKPQRQHQAVSAVLTSDYQPSRLYSLAKIPCVWICTFALRCISKPKRAHKTRLVAIPSLAKALPFLALKWLHRNHDICQRESSFWARIRIFPRIRTGLAVGYEGQNYVCLHCDDDWYWYVTVKPRYWRSNGDGCLNLRYCLCYVFQPQNWKELSPFWPKTNGTQDVLRD